PAATAHTTPPLFPYTTLFRSSTEPLAQGMTISRRTLLTAGLGAGVVSVLAACSSPAPAAPTQASAAATPAAAAKPAATAAPAAADRKSTRLNSSHRTISYAVF